MYTLGSAIQQFFLNFIFYWGAASKPLILNHNAKFMNWGLVKYNYPEALLYFNSGPAQPVFKYWFHIISIKNLYLSFTPGRLQAIQVLDPKPKKGSVLFPSPVLNILQPEDLTTCIHFEKRLEIITYSCCLSHSYKFISCITPPNHPHHIYIWYENIF